jgi:hypothetical protein
MTDATGLSEVKRYRVEGYTYLDHAGDAVHYDDYAALAARLKACEGQLAEAGREVLGMGPLAERIRATRKNWTYLLNDAEKHVDQLQADLAANEEQLLALYVALDGLPFSEKVDGKPYAKHLSAVEQIKRLRADLETT